MFRIAIIEDQDMYCKELVSLLESALATNESRIDSFLSGEEFLSSKWKDVYYAAVFIDIELNGINGMELARQLRTDGFENMIVFTTNYDQFVYQGYEVEAFRYLKKPVQLQDVKTCVDRIRYDERNKSLVFSFNRKQYRIPYHDILYISSYGHYLTIHTNTIDYEWKRLLKELQPELPERFVRCHRSFIVNLDHFRKLDGKRILLDNGEEIDMATSYLDYVRKAVSRLV